MNGQSSGTLEEAIHQLEQGDAAGAIRNLHQILRETPNSFPARLKLAEAYLAKAGQGDPLARTMALREFDRALQLVPEEEQAHILLGELAIRLGQAAGLKREYEGTFKSLPFAARRARDLEEADSGRMWPRIFRRLPTGPFAIVLLIAAAGIALWFFDRGRPVFTQPMPAQGFVLSDLNGADVALSDFAGKKVVVLDFWATWCPPCRASLPALDRFRKRYAELAVEILSVNLEEKPQRIRDYLSSQGLSLRVLLDSDGAVAQSYRIQGIPTLLVIDKQGKERARVVGYKPDLESYLDKTVKSLL